MAPRVGSWVLVLLALAPCAASTRAAGQAVLTTIELPFADEAEVRGVVSAHAGMVRGGVFEAGGWRTTSREDAILIPLPAGVPASEGTLTLVFTTPYLPPPAGWFEAYHLASLDTTGIPFRATATGAPGVQILYVLHDEAGVVRQAARGYFNLADPTCSDWRACTAEEASERYWLRDVDERYQVEHRWAGPRDEVTFTARGTTRSRSIDLSPTSPAGRVAADRLFLSINPCGGSTHPHCGLWDGPENGGPVGLTYVSARLELRAVCGDGTCSAPLETCGACADDCGPCPDGDAGWAGDAGLPFEVDAGVDASASPLDAASPTDDAGPGPSDAGPPDAGEGRASSGGCASSPGRGGGVGGVAVLVLIAAARLGPRRRAA